MKKILNALMLLCAVLLVGCATTHIMNPESVACVNFGSGTGLTANEVVRNGKETVIHFTMNYRPKSRRNDVRPRQSDSCPNCSGTFLSAGSSS